MSSQYPPYYAYPSAPPPGRSLPKPPRLHWGWVLALTILTLGLFASVWMLVQAVWVRRMRQGESTGFWLALANVLWIPLVLFFSFGLGILSVLAPSPTTAALIAAMDPIVRLGSFALFVSAAFVLRGEMQAEPIGIPLGAAATFFFAVLYFQYHLREYGEMAGEGTLGHYGHTPQTEPAYPTAAEVGVVFPEQLASPPTPSEPSSEL